MIEARSDHAGHPARARERLPGVAEKILQHESPDARARVDNRQDEEGLEHDGEVIPEGQHGVCRRLRGRRCAPFRARATGAPPVRLKSVTSPTFRGERGHLVRGDRKAPAGDRSHGGLRGCTYDAGGRVHREVNARIDHAGGDHRHDRDEALEKHRAVADRDARGIRATIILGVVPEEIRA